MKKNDYFVGECVDYTHDAQGVVKVDGFAVFVKNMIKGEIGQIKIIKVLKNYAVGRLISLEKESPYRTDPVCPLFKQCGGCHIQHLNHEGQQEFKTNRVKECFNRIGHMDIEVKPCVMAEEPLAYRNKVQVPVGSENHHLITGFYKPHSNDIVRQDYCYLHNELSNAVVARTRELLEICHEKAYNKVNKSGNIKHILVKYGYHTNEIMVVIITFKNKIKQIDRIVNELTKDFPLIKTIIHNYNPRTDNVILGESINVLYGKGYIEDTLLDNFYRISTHSFFQINPMQVERLYSIAIDLADLKPTDHVIDAYCGIGTISLSMASKVEKVIGVEVVPQAIVDAKENAIRNNITNAEFYCDDAGEFMDHYQDHIDVLFVDPPRKGCSQVFLDSVIRLSPEKVVYVSCDVATQARDCDYLHQNGYEVKYCQPVDMFPQTHHVETVVLLSKMNTTK